MTSILPEQKHPKRPPHGWFAKRIPKIGECFFCRNTDGTFEVGSISPDYRCCRRCIEYRGLEALKNGADEAIAALAGMANTTCRHCSEPVIASAKGLAPLWCSKCESERNSLGR